MNADAAQSGHDPAPAPASGDLAAENAAPRERVVALEGERPADAKRRESFERELAVSQEVFQRVFSTSHNGISITDLTNDEFVACNSSFCRILGYSREELIGRSAKMLGLWKHPEERAKFLAELLTKRTLLVDELETYRKNGETATLAAQFSIIDIMGKVHSIAIVTDISERKKGEAALSASEARFREIFAESPIAIESYDAQGRLLEVNRACLELFGVVEPAEVRDFRLFEDPNLPADARAKLERGETVHYEVSFDFEKVRSARLYRTTRSGVADLSVSVSPVGSPAARRGYLVHVVDVTERRRAEAATQEALLRLQFALQSARQGVWDWDLRTNNMIWDDQMLAFYGLTRGQFVGGVEAWREGLHPDDRDRAIAECQAALDGIRPFDTTFRVLRRDGTVVHVKADGLVLRDPSGTPIRMLGVNQDVTERKNTQDALAANETKYKQLFARMSLGAALHRIVCDDAGRPLDYITLEVNATFERIMGLRADAIVGRRVSEFLPAQELAAWVDRFAPVALHGSTATWETYSPVNQKWFAGNAYSPEPGFFVAIFADVTAEKQAATERAMLRDQLYHAQKMEAVGTLAGGIAHDFNNILGGVLGGLSLLELELGDAGGRVLADINDMKDVVRRGADLSRQLLGFSRRGKYDVAPRDLREVVQKTADLFGRTRRDIALELDFAADLDRALVDHAQIEQVLLNLFINAAHAMPDGGRLSVRAENVTVAPAEATPHGVSPGRFVSLVVTDTGTGIDPAVLPRVFEPFFTTKAVGHGTGLGLASVYGIVKNHEGFINVESELGKGTTFRVMLPATDEPARDRPTSKVALRRGTGTILVVDDEETVREFTARLLRGMGYAVLTAGGGRAAVNLVDERRAEISLVMLDMTMPEMSGAATFDAIREIAPAMKVLLASGYAVDGQAQALLDRGCSGFIQKPFDAAGLSEKLQTIL